MAAAVLRRDSETTTDLLCRLDGVGHRLAVPDETERALVQDQRRVDQLAVIAEQPAGAVAAATLFIGGEGDDNVAVWNVAVFFICTTTAVKIATCALSSMMPRP